MEPILSQITAAFRTAIQDAFGLDIDPAIAPRPASGHPDEKFGDYQSNAAMGLAKAIGEKTGQKTNPRQVAEQIKAKLDLGEKAAEISIAGPGFINVRLSPAWLACLLQQAGGDERLGVTRMPTPQRVVIDYSSPNVAKQMHVGHLRPTNIGDALSRILEFQGNDVIRQNHLGDWGTQFGMLLTYLDEIGKQGQNAIADLDAFYKAAKKRFDEDTNFADKSRQMVVQLQGGDPPTLALWQRIIAESRKHFQAIYDLMNIKLRAEDERGESFYNQFLGDVVTELKQKNVAEESQGATVVFVKGFDAPLIIQKTGGGFGYGTTDLAALRFRIQQLHAGRIVYVTDARQAQHFRQFLDAAKRAEWTDKVQIDHVMFGMILGEDGTPFKARSGESVRLFELLTEAISLAFNLVTQKNPDLPEADRQQIARAVGIGAIKYFDLNRDPNGNYVFDWNKMLSLDGNTAPYLQYVYARIKSIFRKAGTTPAAQDASINLDSPFELSLAKHVLRFGEVIEIVSRDLKSHHLCNYLYDLATRFSAFYENCPVLQSEEPTRGSRLSLCHLTARTMALGLDLLGIEHPEQM